MRNAQKQEVLGCVESLQQAHEEIKNALNGGNYGLVQNMLSQCQEFAVSLGENIEKLEGEGHATVACLEEYCETLYHVYEKLGSDGEGSGKIYKKLRRQLLRVEGSARNDIRVRKEVVFLPYKASMWDSLESVWKAADEDPDCDAYVIPIPYYDKNPDGSFGDKHYEGLEYPKNIEVIDWESYNFEERRPDEIYIHNPYDNCNLVTSVHPRFYSGNLKKYTEKLVYIPYFTLGEIDIEDQVGIDGIKHFIWVPGVINADKVIVQSEKMKQIYVNEYWKAAMANGMTGKHLDRKYLQQKFLGLGSPKFDKVLSTKKENLNIPQEWLKKIQKPDGNWKKIIFYNTAISALLLYNEEWIEKIENSLRVFKENQEETTLLWRPHPLVESTMKSMRSSLLGRYLEIKNRYLEEGWGIYDDTTDLERAVVLSDAYYGDGSSVIQLYQKTGKPIMHQNVSKNDVTENVFIHPYIVAKINDDLYMLDGVCNFIYKNKTGGQEVLIQTELDNSENEYGYIDVIEINNKLVFIPDKSDKFAIYDTIDNSIEYVNIAKDNWYTHSNNYSKPAFYKAVKYKNKVFVIQSIGNNIACINCEGWEIQFFNVLNILRGQNIKCPAFFYADCGVIGECIYIPVCGSEYILVFNMENENSTLVYIEKNACVSTICVHDYKLYIFNSLGTAYYEIEVDKWSVKKVNIQLPIDFIQNSGGNELQQIFIGSFCFEGYIWLIPYSFSNMILKIRENESVAEYAAIIELCEIYSYNIIGKELWINSSKGSIRVDLQTQKVENLTFSIEESSMSIYAKYLMKKRNNIITEKELSLANYIKYMIGRLGVYQKDNFYEEEQKNIYWHI